uniref:[Fe-Fe] hydrogenase large subunit C-terminal domain-containing protein n=1 Tax=Candidatus Fimivicinus sp. TaxID=3056640 RepID=UPI003FEE03AC
METFYALYEKLARAALAGRHEEALREVELLDFDPHQLDCLLHPQHHAPVWRLSPCDCEEGESACLGVCPFHAIRRNEDGNIEIDQDTCTGCSLCIDACKARKLTQSRDTLPVLEAVANTGAPVYALIAPAFVSQFSGKVTPGRLRSAFKALGFAGMVEVALFADILTLKEALDFDELVRSEEDFLLTSCCCPVWIAMIRKVYRSLTPHIPASVSPMIACGRAVKRLVPGAVTVFIGPCVAKKAEAREKDIADAIDFVLTFQEIQDVFAFASIDPERMEEDLRDHSSRAGRIYAHTGGVSEAVKTTLERLRPGRRIPLKARQTDGVPACKKMLNELMQGEIRGNFLEGMGCVGGCVGGPKTLLPREEGALHVAHYGEAAPVRTPVDNPYAMELLRRLGYETVESLTQEDTMFRRNF